MRVSSLHLDNGCISLQYLFLKCGIEPAVIDAESNKLQVLACDSASSNGGILLLKVLGELRAIMSTVGLGEDTKVSVLVYWELGVEGLDQLPYVGSCGHSAVNRVGAV